MPCRQGSSDVLGRSTYVVVAELEYALQRSLVQTREVWYVSTQADAQISKTFVEGHL